MCILESEKFTSLLGFFLFISLWTKTKNLFQVRLRFRKKVKYYVANYRIYLEIYLITLLSLFKKLNSNSLG